MTDSVLPQLEAQEIVLVMEDNLSTALGAQRELRKALPEGSIVDVATDIVTAEAWLMAHPNASLLLADVQMPPQEGMITGVNFTCDLVNRCKITHVTMIVVSWSDKGLNDLVHPQICPYRIDFKTYEDMPKVVQEVVRLLRERRKKMLRAAATISAPKPPPVQ
jgi:CheY-like chemotaxis protein